MSKASKLAILDSLLPQIEAFAAGRLEQTALRREMRAAKCTHEDVHQTAGEHGEEIYCPCYGPDGRTPWCEACRRHDAAFHALLAARKANRKRWQKIERLAIRYAAPEVMAPPEPKLILELLDKQEAEA